jgi:nitrate reductase gamma subunit
VALVAVAALFAFRLASPAARTISRFQDWALLALVAVAFSTGYWVAHPVWGPLRFETTYLLHLLSAEALLVLLPFSKLSHAVLLPLSHISWDVGWHFVPGAGDRVRAALGKEGEPV